AAAMTKQYLTMFFSHLSRTRSGAARSEQTSAALLPLGSIAISSVAQRWLDRLQSNARGRLEDTKYGVGIPRFALHPVSFGSLAVHQRVFECGVEFRHAPVFSQHLKNNRRGPSKQQYSVHSRHWAKQTPTFHWHNVAISQRCVVHECKINEIGVGGRGIDQRI